MSIFIILGFFILLFLVALLWILVPGFFGLPSIPTRPDRIRRALQLANLQPDEILYDLGAGDGRVLLIAAREFDANAIGVEVGPMQCVLIWLKAVASGFGNKIQVHWANFYHADLHEADVIFVYATSREVARLAPLLQKQLKKGARVASISADFPEWEPFAFDEHELIFVYEMPPVSGNLGIYLIKQG